MSCPIWNSDIVRLYPSDPNTPSNSYKRKDNNDNIHYRINNGEWSAYSEYVGNDGNDVWEEIRLTVPENGVTVEFQDNWTQLKADDITVSKAQITTQSSQAALSLSTANAASPRMLLKSPSTFKANTKASGQTPDVGPINNTGTIPNPSNPDKECYNPDSWELSVTMKNGGKLLDKDGNEIGTVTVEGRKWSVSLKGADFDGLTGTDDDGNMYYYYIDSISENNVPEKTRPSIINEEDGTRYLYSKKDQDDKTGRVLTAKNEIITVSVNLEIIKADKTDQTIKLICNDICQGVTEQESPQTYSVLTEGIVKEL